MTKDEALRLALEALETSMYPQQKQLQAITAVKAALLSRSDGKAKGEIDWKDMYEKQKRHTEMWVAKYEKDIGPLEKAVPQQEAKNEPVTKAIEEQAYESGYSTGFMDGAIKTLEAKDEPVAWRDAAIRLGEELSSVGPDGYYDMDAKEWLDWAMEQKPRGEHSLPQRTWVGLTEAQCGVLWKLDMSPFDYYQAIEAKLKEKNT